MGILRTLTLLTFVNTAVQAETKFVWIQTKANNISSGVCVEIDKNLTEESVMGKAQFDYTKKVSSERCRPSDKDISYYFSPTDGRCFEGDSKSGGQKYFRYAKIKYCRTKQTEFRILTIRQKKGCWELDVKSEGANFHRLAKDIDCQSEDTQYSWVRYNERRGVCYSFDPKSGSKLKMNYIYCRPNQPIYNFKRISAFKGICLEQSSSSNNTYSKSVQNKFCKPSDTSLFFYKKPNEVSGHCYEVDTETRGDNYLNMVDAKDCK